MTKKIKYYKINLVILQGRVEIPTGGTVRERKLNLCNSGTDSRVWMIEEAPEAVGHFLMPKAREEL